MSWHIYFVCLMVFIIGFKKIVLILWVDLKVKPKRFTTVLCTFQVSSYFPPTIERRCDRVIQPAKGHLLLKTGNPFKASPLSHAHTHFISPAPSTLVLILILLICGVGY